VSKRVMKRFFRILVVLAAGGALLASDPAWARGRGGHHFHHRRLFVGSFFIAPPLWYAYHPGPYYYGPAFEATNIPPSVYIEKFEGTPNAESGEIYCPQENQYYPDVQDCPNGWQRVIRPAEQPARGG
jgi:hypothetical protein